MKNITQLFLILVFALGCTACGAQWTGNWSGAISTTVTNGVTTGNPTAIAMTLYQSGSTVNGYWLATGGTYPASGQLQGTVSGSTLATTLTVPQGETTSVPGSSSGAGTTLQGTLTISGSTATGSVTGTQSSTSSGVTMTFSSLTQQNH